MGARGYWPYFEDEMSTTAWVEHQFMGEFTVQEFNAEDFSIEHEKLLEQINGQWLDETENTTLWLSQARYSQKIIQILCYD